VNSVDIHGQRVSKTNGQTVEHMRRMLRSTLYESEGGWASGSPLASPELFYFPQSEVHPSFVEETEGG
jgi:hypothetical protein